MKKKYWNREVLLSCFLAIVLPIFAVCIQLLIHDLLGGVIYTFLFLFPLVFYTSWLGGFWTGVLSSFTTAVTATFLNWQSISEMDRLNLSAIFNLLLYLFVAFLTSYLVPNARKHLIWTQGKQLRDSLNVASSQLNHALIAAHAGTWEWSLETKESHWSPTLWRLYGLDPTQGEAGFELWLQTIKKEEWPVIEAKLNRMVKMESDIDFEWELLGSSPPRWLMSRGSPQRDSSGKVTGYAGIVVDITERKVASEAQFQSLFNTMVEGFCIVDVIFDSRKVAIDFRFLEINAAFERQTGLMGAKGKTMKEITPLHEEYWFEIFGSIALTGEPRSFVNEAKELGRWFEVSAYRMGEAESRKVAIIFNDITQLKLNEKELERVNQEARARADELQAVLDTAPVAIWIAHDADCKNITGNIFADQLLMNSTRGANVSASMVGNEGNFSYQAFRRGVELSVDQLPVQVAARTGKPVAVEELELRFADHEKVTLLTGAVPLFDAQGQVRGAICTASDISDLKIVEENLRSEVEIRDEFLSIASHELKTPLASLVLQLELIAKFSNGGAGDSNKVSMLTRKALRSVQRLGSLLDELLDITQIKVGKINIQPTEIDLNSLVKECVESFAEQAKDKGYSIQYLEEKFVVGKWDSRRISQIISNLLSNAIKYGESKPVEVKVSVDERTGFALISVKDNGVGISENMRSKIFDRFERATSDKKISGLGLGLYIVKKIVEAHAGSISVISELGKGSEFRVLLPTHLQKDSKEFLQNREVMQLR